MNKKFWAKYSIFILLAIGVITVVLRANDPAFEGLKNYLFNSSDINSYVGEVESYRIVNTRYVSETDDAPGFNEYRIKIVGSDGAVTLKIRAENIEVGNGWKYSITHKYDE
jgi:hypothetical protein